jgi:hypothetical protein
MHNFRWRPKFHFSKHPKAPLELTESRLFTQVDEKALAFVCTLYYQTLSRLDLILAPGLIGESRARDIGAIYQHLHRKISWDTTSTMLSCSAIVVTLLYIPCVFVNAQLFPSNACSICPTTLPQVGSPDVVLDAGFAGVLTEDQTCAETETLAQSGAYSRASCVLLRTSGITIICGCKEDTAPAPVSVPVSAPVPVPRPVAVPVTLPVVKPTESPIAAVIPTATPIAVAVPTGAPIVVAVPTAAPIIVTVAPATLAPSIANVTSNTPTMVQTASKVPTTVSKAPSAATLPPVKLFPITEQVVLRLISTPGSLSESASKTFRDVCGEFYAEFLPGTVVNVSCALPATARRLEETQSSFHLRSLQSGTQPLDVKTNVTAFFDPTGGITSFADDLIATAKNSSDTFVNRLRTGGDPVSMVYYDKLTEIEAFAPSAVPPIAAPAPVPTAAAPVSAPVSAPAVPPVKKNGRLATGAIVGIVIGVLVGIALLLGVGAVAMNSNPNPQIRVIHTDPVGEDFPSPHAKQSVPKPMTTSYTKEAEIAIPSVAAVVAKAAVGRDTEGTKDGMSVMTGSEMDTYSLDPGNVDQPSSAPGTKRDTVDGMSQSGDEMSSHAMSSLRQNMISRTVIAPPGKLGIVIDTTLEGPVVHKINPQSPLEGTLFPGDIIVAIDDVDTRAMSASAITALMVRTANLRRKLTVLSEDVTN